MAGKRVIDKKTAAAQRENRAEGHKSSRGTRVIKKSKAKRRIITTVVVLVVLAALYLTAVFSNNAFIAKWRTIYIETAMSTRTHQWLATAFIPGSVIDEVMAQVQADMDAQLGLESTWGEETTAPETKAPETTAPETEPPVEETEDPELLAQQEREAALETLLETYWELDTQSFRSYMARNPELYGEDGYDSLMIDNLDETLAIESVNGDQVVVVDVENNVLIVEIDREDYEGKLAITKNAAQVDLVNASRLGIIGDTLGTFYQNTGCVVAINGSGFGDAEGHGNGGLVVGSSVVDGKEYGKPYWSGSNYKFFGMKYDNRFYITNYDNADITEYRWAFQFFPALIVNGKSVVDGSYGMGLQPRSAIGQAENGDFLMLVIDGRQLHSIGCTVATCTEILLEYGAYQATNLDGGSSSLMLYKGEKITSPSSKSSEGRYLPNALIVRPASEVE